jgi:oligo-1,6-glucosidase
MQDPDSILNYDRKLIRLRKEHEVAVYGSYELVEPDYPSLYAYTRTLGDETWLILCSFSDLTTTFHWPKDLEYTSARLLIGNYHCEEQPDRPALKLRPFEARAYRLLPSS